MGLNLGLGCIRRTTHSLAMLAWLGSISTTDPSGPMQAYYLRNLQPAHCWHSDRTITGFMARERLFAQGAIKSLRYKLSLGSNKGNFFSSSSLNSCLLTLRVLTCRDSHSGQNRSKPRLRYFWLYHWRHLWEILKQKPYKDIFWFPLESKTLELELQEAGSKPGCCIIFQLASQYIYENKLWAFVHAGQREKKKELNTP